MKLRLLLLSLSASFAVETLSQSARVERARYLMGTVCKITAPAAAESRIAAAFDETARIESFLSTWRDDSELSKLNRDGQARVSPELFALLQTAVAWQQRTGGAFDPLIAPLVDAWRTREEGAVPKPEAMRAALLRTNIENVSFSPPSSVRLRNRAEFEEGGFGKGFAVDRMLAILPSPAVVNFGGQLGVRGTSVVTIADPERRDVPIVAFEITDSSLSTSSGSEQTFQVEGRRFSHIIDPRSGEALPARGSASVLSDDGLTADILSTALYVMGPEEGLRWAEANDVAALFVTADYRIRISPAFKRRARSLEILTPKFKSGEEP